MTQEIFNPLDPLGLFQGFFRPGEQVGSLEDINSERPVQVPISSLRTISDPNIPLERLAVEDRKYIVGLTERIRRNGLQEPLLVIRRENRQLLLWEGHHRLLALENLGETTAPVLLTTRSG